MRMASVSTGWSVSAHVKRRPPSSNDEPSVIVCQSNVGPDFAPLTASSRSRTSAVPNTGTPRPTQVVLEGNVRDRELDPVVGMDVTDDDAGEVLERDVLLQVRRACPVRSRPRRARRRSTPGSRCTLGPVPRTSRTIRER